MTKLTADQLEEIKAAMLKVNFKYRQSNGIDNYLHAAILQGIEMKGTNINPFVVGDDGERVYGYDQVGNETRAAVLAIEEILNTEKEQVPEPAKKELEPVKGELIPKEEKQLYGILPGNLTDALIKNHPGTTAVLIGLQKTPPQYVKEVKKGGKMRKYVDGPTMKREANYAFLFRWDSEVLEMWEDEFEISALVRCEFHFTEGHTVIKTQVGCADKIFSKSLKDKDGNKRCIMLGDTRKAAITDAIKKELADMGFNQDVYEGLV